MSKKLDKNLSEIFDVTPLTDNQITEVIPAIPIEEIDANVESDFNYARSNIRNLIRQGSGAVDGILRIADASEHPRAFEVAANLIKTMAEMNKDLLDIQKKKQELTGSSPQKGDTNINVDKAVFVGSTIDLIRKIKEENNGNTD